MTLKTLITIGLAAAWMTLGAHAATAGVEPSGGTIAGGSIPAAPVLAPDTVDRLTAANQAATLRYSDSAESAVAAVNVPTNSIVAPATSSGTEIEWPQVGIGFGIGMLLAFGLFLTLRLAHVRPLAH